MATNMHFPKSHRTKIAAVVIAGALVVSGVGAAAAFAAGGTPGPTTTAPAGAHAGEAVSPDTLAAAKDRVNLSVDRGLAALDVVATRTAADPSLTATEHATVDADVSAARAALNGLKTKVDGETTLAAVRSDVKAARAAAKADPAIVQAQLLARIDAGTAVIDRINTTVPRLQIRLQKAQTAGKDVSKAQAALTDLQAKAADAGSHLSGLSAAVLSGQSGAQANAEAALKVAQGDLAAIRTDVKTIRQSFPAAAGAGKAAGHLQTPPTSTP